MRRIRALSLVAVAGLVAWACTEGPGPTGGERVVELDLAPRFQLDPGLFSYDPIDRIRLVATDVETSDVVGRFDGAVDPSADRWAIPLAVELGDALSLQVIVEIELFSGASVEWSGRAGPLEVPATAARAVDVYRGPLDNLDVLAVGVDAPPTQLIVGASAAVFASVTLEPGSDATPMVFWASTDPEIATVTETGPTATIMAVAPGTTNIFAAAGEAFFEFTLEVVPLPSSVVRTWSGGDGGGASDWGNPNNWSPVGVPFPVDDVVIPSTQFQPVMSSNESVRSLDVAAGVTVNQSGFTLTIARDVTVNGTLANGLTHLDNVDPTVYTIAGTGTFGAMLVTAPRQFSGDLELFGDLDVRSELSVGPSVVIVNGDLTVQTAQGSLVMNQVGSYGMAVTGSVTFDGASSVGNLTAGTLQVQGDFTAGSTHSSTSFQSTGTLVYMVAGAALTISLDNPTEQYFADLYLLATQAGSFLFASSATVTGTLFGGGVLRGSGSSVLEVTGTIELDQALLDGLPLRLVSDVSPELHALEGLTFTNMPPNVDHLHVELIGAGANFLLLLFDPVFETPPSNGYYYLSVVNADPQGQVLFVELINPSPSPPPVGTVFGGPGTEVIWP